ncbi:class II glutamine amidotransferase [Streptomyces sp. NPDC092307]|uniref:class II glutamine amidotransferase n=1 Tax=Streptomyces sp. NPDC092307 TaxID=3366013 RepID=UPI003803EA51
MCRWLAYCGSPIPLDTVLLQPEHSLLDQSLRSRMSPVPTHGDGFGIGWYGTEGDGTPAVFREAGPAWNNRNLRELAHHIRSPLFFAHVRSSTGSPVQESNCHPFRHGRWLWMHNGAISEFSRLRRDLSMAVPPALAPYVQGSTDSETMFFLAIGLGLYEDVPGAMARMVELVERTGRAHGVPDPLQMTVAVSDGTHMWAFRYSTSGSSRSLFYSTGSTCLPESGDVNRLVVSEPLDDRSDEWIELPEASYIVLSCGTREPALPFVVNRAVPVYEVGASAQEDPGDSCPPLGVQWRRHDVCG